jgi:hypothetical protein
VNNGEQVRLLAGRKLDYEVKGATVEEEAGFVTVIRYTLDYPLGKSTALFNTRSGAMEVSHCFTDVGDGFAYYSNY